ncbi:hypothetical protein B0J15DRAFT_566185, partial [Fusarium solani]
MKKLQYGLQLLAFISLFGSVTSRPIRYIQIKAPDMKPPLTPEESQWGNRFEAGLELYDLYSKGFASIQCFENMALASTVDGGADTCDTSDPTSSIHVEKADAILMPEQYRQALNRFNRLALDNKIFPMALEPCLKQDPEALLAIINLPSEARSAATKKFGRILAEENARDDQKALSEASKAASAKKGKVLSFGPDDEEGVGLIVGYIARQAFGKPLDFLDDDPYYGLHPDEDDIPKNLLSKTTKLKMHPAIFKGDWPVSIREANFYAARKILHPSKDGRN